MPERTLTVKEVTGRKDVPLQHGAFVEYRFHVEEFGDEVVWLRKGSNPDAPSGQITGELTPSDHGLKFKLAPKGAGGGSFPSGQRDDVTGRSIERQVSAKATAEMLAPIAEKLGSAQTVGDAFALLFDRVDAKVRGEA